MQYIVLTAILLLTVLKNGHDSVNKLYHALIGRDMFGNFAPYPGSSTPCPRPKYCSYCGNLGNNPIIDVYPSVNLCTAHYNHLMHYREVDLVSYDRDFIGWCKEMQMPTYRNPVMKQFLIDEVFKDFS